jgi:iron complex transport system substrate-binding protein
MMRGTLFPLVFLLLAACVSPGAGDRKVPVHKDQIGLSYASKFRMQEVGEHILLTVSDPWQNSRGVEIQYLLGKDPDRVPDSLGQLPFIRIPVRRVVTMSTTHLAMIRELGEEQSLVGISGTALVYDPLIREAIALECVMEVGFDQALDYEALVGLDPDVLFYFGVEGSASAQVNKLESLGIPVVYCAEYLEEHPLGKAEWIRYFGAFFGKNDQARSFFAGVDTAYDRLRRQAAGATTHPAVFMGLPWKDTWYVAGGESFAARLIRDAGARYLWADTPSREAMPMDLESVYVRALEAEFWINPGVAGTLEELHTFDERFGALPAFSGGRVYNNNRRLGPGGGNDYWESGTLRPDLVLADLVRIFHPEILPDTALYYYQKLK